MRHKSEDGSYEKFLHPHNTRRKFMTRGRPPLQAQEDANPIAEKRGLVRHYQHEKGAVCDFTIMNPERVDFVQVRRVRRLCCSIEELVRVFSADIAALRFIVSSPAISRELWICSPKGVWRFFRICDQSILELGRDGMPLAPAVPALTKKIVPAGPVPAAK